MKYRLLAPGPTPVPEETLLELAKPVGYHRSAEFRSLLLDAHADLQYVFQTKNPVLTLTSSGTGGLEAAIVNCLPRGSKAICLVAGRFGERWLHLCKTFGIEAITIKVPWGESVQPEQVEHALREHPDARVVCSTLSETSTGAAHDIAAFGQLTAERDTLLLVDAISGLGAMEYHGDEWNVDICITGSQKALMLPPGLAFVSVSEKALKQIEANPTRPTFYFDLLKAHSKLQTGDTPWTPAHTLIAALRRSLKRIRKEGIENLWARQRLHARAARAGVEALGMRVFPRQPVDGLTVAEVPPGIDGNLLLTKLEKQYGLKLAGGQEQLKGRIIRLAHMGYIDRFDVLTGLAGLELVLKEMGHPVKPGAGLAAAQAVFMESFSGAR